MTEILLSLKPKWWEKIASGEKTVEIRKTAPNRRLPFKVLVYETKEGRGAIVGEFKVRGVIKGFTNSLYPNLQSCLTDEEIEAYGHGKAYGWEISNVRKYRKPIPLSEIGISRAPQSWIYL